MLNQLDLSVIIVSWNVCVPLRECLQTVDAALQGISSEVIVVDNDSADDTVGMIRSEYSWIKLLPQTRNLGFGKACNKALSEARGEYILFLNPDTRVATNSIRSMLEKLKTDEKIGFIGPKVLNADGSFQPACRRSVPTPKSALFKMIGLSYLCPRHPELAKYHLGHMSEDEEGEVEAISGSCMLIPRRCLVAGFDERFFMYGEDLDLCVQIRALGYRGYYFPQAQITHLYRQSSQKRRFKSLFHFYHSAYLFFQKHYAHKVFWGTRGLIYGGLCLRMLIAYAKALGDELAWQVRKIGAR